MITTTVRIDETDGLNQIVHTHHFDEPEGLLPPEGPRGVVVDAQNHAKLLELLRELTSFAAEQRSTVQTITITFHQPA